jgi:hypothetical protein
MLVTTSDHGVAERNEDIEPDAVNVCCPAQAQPTSDGERNGGED